MSNIKNHLSSYKKHFLTSSCALFFSQFFVSILLFVFHVNSGSSAGEAICTAFATSSLISLALLLLSWVIFAAIKADILLWVGLFGALLIIIVFSMFMSYGWGFFIYCITGAWMNFPSILFFSIIGIVSLALSFGCIYYYEFSNANNKQPSKQKKEPLSDAELINQAEQLKDIIKDNSIVISFLKNQWGFPANKSTVFGFDVQNNEFIFVGEKRYHTISSKKIVFLDYEELSSATNNSSSFADISGRRLAKLYYLGKNSKEYIIPFSYESDSYLSDNKNHIEILQAYTLTTSSKKEDLIFRRRIRHLASTLDKTEYPLRPFINDEWFQLLQNCMEKVKNTQSDGYSLFRKKTAANDTYMKDSTLLKIIGDLSKDPPDNRSSKQEAKRLCFPTISRFLHK